MRIAFIRHGITSWNEEQRIQGQSDIALSAAGIRQVQRWHLPNALENPVIHSSPLRRCLQTAAIMGFASPKTDGALMEMNWGQWEGKKLTDLRKSLGDEMKKNEQSGIDFQPPNGESPRQVSQRLYRWIQSLDGQDRLVFTHKGVLRAAYSLALDWNMKQDLDFKLNRDAMHLFSYDGQILNLLKENILLQGIDGPEASLKTT